PQEKHPVCAYQRWLRDILIDGAATPPNLGGELPGLRIAFLLQRRSGSIDLRSGIFERLRNHGNLLARLIPIVLLDGLADTRKCFHAVTRVEAGSVDLMLEPGPSRKAPFGDHCQFHLTKTMVERLLHLARLQTRDRAGIPYRV